MKESWLAARESILRFEKQKKWCKVTWVRLQVSGRASVISVASRCGAAVFLITCPTASLGIIPIVAGSLGEMTPRSSCAFSTLFFRWKTVWVQIKPQTLEAHFRMSLCFWERQKLHDCFGSRWDSPCSPTIMFKTYLQLSPIVSTFYGLSLFKLIPLGCWFFIAPRSGASPLRNLALQIQGPEGPTWDWEMMRNSQGFSLCEHADWTAGLLSGHHFQSTWMASHRVNIHASLQHPIIIPLSSPCLNHINIFY